MGTVSPAVPTSAAAGTATPVEPPRVVLLVVALGRTARLLDGLRALAAHESRTAYRIVCVVNPGNEPRDEPGHTEVSAALDAIGVPIIDAPINLGWAGGLHRARAAARDLAPAADLLVWVQDDMVVRPGWLDALVDAADHHPAVGAFGSVQVDDAGTPQLFNGGWCVADDLALWSSTDRTPEQPPVGVETRDWVTSKGLAIRAAAWDAIGGPDPSLYPLSYVDLDTCSHLRAHGWGVALVGEARIAHQGQQSAAGMLRRYLAERLTPRVHERWSSVVAELPDGAARAVPHACTADRASDVEGWCAREALDIVVDFGRWAERARRAETAETTAQLAERDRTLAELDAGFRTALEQLAALRAEQDALRATWSWRLTAPLRALQRALRG
jgi:GT2 family glycosyltransferase